MKKIEFENDYFCILGIKGKHIIFSLRENITDLSLHPVFSILHVDDVVSHIRRFSRCRDIEELYDEFLSLKCNFEDLHKGSRKIDTFDIDVEYAVSRLQTGYPYYLRVQPIVTKQIVSYSCVEHPFKNTDVRFDTHVKELLQERQIPYTQIKHKVHLEWHDDAVFDMEIPEDIPQSILKKGKIIEEDEGGCCSQRQCGGYTLEFDILMKGVSLITSPRERPHENVLSL